MTNMTNLSLTEWIQSEDPLSQLKQYSVSFRKYPQWKLGIAKRKYLSPYNKQVSWVNYCRGLVIDYETNQVILIPPPKSRDVLTRAKFLKRVSNSEQLIDGMMINLFNYKDQWFVSTRSTITPLEDITNQNLNLPEVKNLPGVKNLPWVQQLNDCFQSFPVSELQSQQTYSFVMRHKQSRITSIVEDNELVLIEVYENGERLKTLPSLTGIKTPIATQDCIGIQKGLTGFKDGVRYKWLTAEHKFIEMIRPNEKEPLLSYLKLRNSGYLTSYLQLFPEKKYEFNSYRTQVSHLIQLIYQYYVAVKIQKTIDASEIPFVLNPVIHQLHKHYLQTKQGISLSYVKQYIYELEPVKIYFILLNRKELTF